MAKKIKFLDFLYIKGKQRCSKRKVIVAFHGWQGNKRSFLPLTKNLLFEDYDWYLLEGPYKVNNDPEKKTWSYEIEKDVWAKDEPKKIIDHFFSNELFKNYLPENTYVIGFSLGATMLYEYICKIDATLGGIFPISGFSKSKNINLSNKLKKTPILIGHGKKDLVVTPDKSLEAYKMLKKSSNNIRIHIFNGGHRMSTSIINMIADAIKVKK
tara:strand:+ start:6072 stop:6707 length:636 start_codon:yes stop_codon:yes gene_type:complete